MSRLLPSERKLVESLVASTSSIELSFVSRSERAAHVRENGQAVQAAQVSPHIRINNHRRVPVERAMALYRMFGDWHKVAEALPGNFRWFSIQTAVRRAQRG